MRKLFLILTLLAAVSCVEDFIPDTLIEPVAEVLKWAKQIEDARREEEELDSVSLAPLPAAGGDGERSAP